MQAHEHLREDKFESRSTLMVDLSSDTDSAGPSNLCVTDDLQGFEKIRSQGKNVLLYLWSPTSALKTMISRTPFTDLPSFSATIASGNIDSLLSDAPDDLVKQTIIELRGVLQSFAALLPDGRLNIAFCKTHSRSCPLFHVDRVPFRLLCTLRGPGTEWLADDDLRRRGLGKGNNRKVVKPGASVYEVLPFQVCVLKGESQFANAGTGAVHRSPAVPDTIEGRWYLKVDPDGTAR